MIFYVYIFYKAKYVYIFKIVIIISLKSIYIKHLIKQKLYVYKYVNNIYNL